MADSRELKSRHPRQKSVMIPPPSSEYGRSAKKYTKQYIRIRDTIKVKFPVNLSPIDRSAEPLSLSQIARDIVQGGRLYLG